MQKKPNPHHLDIDANSSLIGLNFALQGNGNMTLDELVSRTNRKLRLISILVGAIYKKRLANSFQHIRFKPLKASRLKKRLVQVFASVVRSSEYNHKYETFQKLKILVINSKNQQLKQISTILDRAKLSVIRLIGILIKGIERRNIESGFVGMRQYAKKRYRQKCDKNRRGFRIWIQVHNTVLRKHFLKLRSSRYLVERRLKIQSIAKVLREYRVRCLKSGMQKLRRNLFQERQKSIRQQIEESDKKMQENQDSELKSLKQKQQQLQKSIAEIKKQKEQISHAYQTQVKQAESKNIQIQQRMKQIRQENEKIQQEIKLINGQLNEPYTLNQVYRTFYNNLLCYLAKNRNSNLNKTDMLEALTKPLVPIDLPLQQMKEENSVLKDLLNEYKLIYGEKTLEGREIEIPFEYLVKENKTMYKMLLTLLPQLEYHKKDLTDFRETLESVETIVKEFKG